MKNLFIAFSMLTLVSITFTSCTTEPVTEDENITAIIDPEKECPPNDRNCNGIPDDEE
ncbi:hypothetical protein [Pontimicrobium sp. MEBiC01747]